MVDNKTVFIYYINGAYGTFVEWFLNYFSDHNFDEQLPFLDSGSAHKYMGNLVQNNEGFNKILESEQYYKFVRLHPGATNNENMQYNQDPNNGPLQCYKNELNMLLSLSPNVIFCYFDIDNVLWGINNAITKNSAAANKISEEECKIYMRNHTLQIDRYIDSYFIEFIPKKIATSPVGDQLQNYAKFWGKKDLTEMQVWELREFFSLCLPKSYENSYGKKIFYELKDNLKQVTFLNIVDIKDNFQQTLDFLFKKFNLQQIRKDKINFVFENWLNLQKYKNNDKLVNQIVNCTLHNIYLEWQQDALTIIDEAWIQNLLRNRGFEIKCFNLDKFPTSSTNLYNLLEKLND